MSDSEEEQIDLTSKFGLDHESESEDESSSESSNEQIQDEIVYSDQDESDEEEEEEAKKVTKDKNEPETIPDLELSDDDNEDLKGLIDNSLLPSAKNAKNGTFKSFGLSKKILHNISKRGYKQPTPIQRKSIPFIMQGRDIVGMARTGSGKTAAFLLPLIEKLQTHSAKVGARAVILSPNRELALQTYKNFKEFSRGTNLRSIILVGGDSLEDQFSSMLQNPDVIIATPGRFLHLRTEMSLDLKSVEYIVFDEADQLFEVAFEEQLNELIAALSPNKQAILFSATLPKSLVDFAKLGLNNPVLIRLDSESKISDQLEMCFISAKQAEREANLLHIIQDIIRLPQSTQEELSKLDEFKDQKNFDDSDSESEEEEEDENKKSKNKKKKKFEKAKFGKANELVSPKGTIVFVPTKHHVEYIKNLLNQAGYACSYIYGTLDQHARKRQLYNFKAAITSLLIVTDVAARGIDIPLLKYVINYTLPSSSKLFIHRVGRTARAGNTGFAYSIVTPNEMPSFVEMELFLGRKILLTSMYKKKVELLKEQSKIQGVEYVEPKVSFTDRLVLGSIPRNLLENQVELINLLLKNFELEVLKKVAEKAEKLYYKSKSKVTSVESLKRSREILKNKWDDKNLLFLNIEENGEEAKENLLLQFQNRKKKETVFEFNKNNEKMIRFMSKRRKQISIIQKHAKEREELLEKERMAGLTHSLQDEILKGDKEEVGFNVIKDSDLNKVFENADEIIENNKRKNKKNKQKNFKDPNFFLSHYAPTEDIQDKQYSIDSSGAPSSYANEAQKATFDLNGDDNVQIHKQNAQIMKWSKAKKKYVNSRSTDEKFIMGESGHKIPASYKSGRFEAWKDSNKIYSNNLKVGKEELKSSEKNQRFKHKQSKAPKVPDKFRDDFYKQKKKVESALDKGVKVKGFKRKGEGFNEINSIEHIRKERNQKEKRKEKNGRPSKRRKF